MNPALTEVPECGADFLTPNNFRQKPIGGYYTDKNFQLVVWMGELRVHCS